MIHCDANKHESVYDDAGACPECLEEAQSRVKELEGAIARAVEDIPQNHNLIEVVDMLKQALEKGGE